MIQDIEFIDFYLVVSFIIHTCIVFCTSFNTPGIMGPGHFPSNPELFAVPGFYHSRTCETNAAVNVSEFFSRDAGNHQSYAGVDACLDKHG